MSFGLDSKLGHQTTIDWLIDCWVEGALPDILVLM